MSDEDLIEKLKKYKGDEFSGYREWQKFCSNEVDRSLKVIAALLNEKDINQYIISYAFYGYAESKAPLEWVALIRALFEAVPTPVRSQSRILNGVAKYLVSCSKGASKDHFNEIQLLWTQVVTECMNLSIDIDGRDAVHIALNSPASDITECAMRMFYAASPKVGKLIDGEVEKVFEKIFVGDKVFARLCRVSAVPRLNDLVAVDPKWTKNHFSQHFNWGNKSDAAAMWTALAYGSSISDKLWENVFGEYIFDTLNPAHMPLFRENLGSNLCGLIPLALLELPAVILPEDKLRDCLAIMRNEDLSEFLEGIWRRLSFGHAKDKEGKDEKEIELSIRQRADRLWQSKIQPIFTLARLWIWPVLLMRFVFRSEEICHVLAKKAAF